MRNRWFGRVGLLVVAIATMLAGSVASAAPAEAQDTLDLDVVATCADLAVLGIPEGPRAVEAAESLRARGAPNPSGIEEALDVLIAFADPAGSDTPATDADAAYATLDSYFGEACRNIDRCPLVVQALGVDADAAAEAAGLLWRLETPSPPGIDAALALIAGEVDESPFHSSVAEAQNQIRDYYPCATLAFTGPARAGHLATLGLGLVGAGASALAIQRGLRPLHLR